MLFDIKCLIYSELGEQIMIRLRNVVIDCNL